MDRYEKMTDEQLIQKLRDGDNRIVDYIMEKYKNLGKTVYFQTALLRNRGFQEKETQSVKFLCFTL